MTNFFFKFRKSYFWRIFGPFFQFLERKNFFQKLACHAQLHKNSQQYAKIQRNLMIQLQENTQSYDRREGWTLFHRFLPVIDGVLKSTTAIDWYLKVKDIEHDVGLNKNYCITVIMQKIISIYILMNSRELNDHAHFDHTHP